MEPGPFDTEDAIAALNDTGLFKKNSVVNLFGPQAALLILLYRLDVVGVRKITWTMASLFAGQKLQEPPCSISLAITSINREFIQFCPKRMADKELKI